MSYLSDFKEFDGGYVTFGGGAKGGKITGIGTLKTDGSLFDSSSKNASNDEPQPSSDAGKKDDHSINTANTNDNTGSLNINTVSPTVTTASPEDTYADFFGDETELNMSNITTTYLVPSTPNTRIDKDHSLDNVIGDVQSCVLTRRMTKTTNEQGFISVVYKGKTHKDLHTCLFACFLSQEEPKKVWTLVDLPYDKRAIGTKWVYRNKDDERGIMIRNKARLVVQGYTQEEGIDYDEVFAPVARIEAIRLFMAYASFKDFVVYQMDVKSAFLYGNIEKEVYVCQPPGFEDPEFPDKVYKVKKHYMVYIKLLELGLQVTQKDDGVFISQDKSMIGSLMYLTASRPDIMFVVCACARFQVTPKVLHLHAVKRIFRYLKGQPKLGLWYPKDSPFNLEAYTDSDYAGASLDKKSTTGGCQFLGRRLISWQCKKQTIVANSTTEAEYVAASSCRGQVLWIQNQMLDYEYNFMNTKIFIDNESTICIVKNPVFHSKTKHIEIRHHFIRDSNEKRLIQMIKIHTNQNVADLLIKAFDVGRFQYLIFCDTHNMVAYLKKLEGSKGFHQIVDFLNASHIQYALTENPTIYVSLIQQFWQTATASTLNNGEMEITATIDGKVKIVTEASIRRHLKLEDSDGISILPITEIFEQLALMGFGNNLVAI
ncbi:putative ribonuclease H-like domain-containing protein [Tanacetum coccineum]